MEEYSGKWIIMGWAYNRMFATREFASFEDGWEFIYENIEDEDNAYDDIFVVTKEEYFEKLRYVNSHSPYKAF